MKILRHSLLLMLSMAVLATCSKRDEDLVEPLSLEAYPQVIFPDDEGDGDVEDGDKVGIKLTLLDRVDPTGDELGGLIIPLEEDVTVNFVIKDPEGFSNLGEYFLEWIAFYEIDDCTTSEDLDEDLNLTFNANTGEGSVTFPRDVEEIEIEFELTEDLFDDDEFNEDGRGFVFQLTGVESGGESVKVNTDLEFEYEVLDDEGIFGEWELDIDDAEQFENFKNLFGLVDGDIAELEAEDVDEIVIEFKYDELSVLVVLVEEELVEECGESEMENVEIEIEMDYDDLTDDALSGEASFEGEIEFEDGSVGEFEYGGEFSIDGDQLTITLEGEYDDESTDVITLVLSK